MDSNTTGDIQFVFDAIVCGCTSGIFCTMGCRMRRWTVVAGNVPSTHTCGILYTMLGISNAGALQTMSFPSQGVQSPDSTLAGLRALHHWHRVFKFRQ